MWKFVSNSSGTAEGPWIDDLHIERYNQPVSASNVPCEDLDPTISAPSVPGNAMVSKGLILPPYLNDDFAGRIQRLVDTGVHWVRLEFIASPNDLSTINAGAPALNNRVNRIDFKHYDRLIDSLCAS